MILDFPSTKESRKIAKKYGYDEFIIRRWLKFFGKDTIKIIEAFEKVPKYIRVNTIKISDTELIKRLEKRGFEFEKSDVNYCWEVKKESYSIGATPEYLMGYYYIMDKSSCLPPLSLDPKPKDLVLDLAASPGGKTTFLSMLMKNRGAIIAVEPQSDRIQALIDNINRMGAMNVSVIQMDGRNIAKLGIEFDKVLLDAPCSGEGVIYKDPSRKFSRGAKDVEFCSFLQKELIIAAFDVLKRDGVMVYSTCSMAPEENEFVLDFLLKNRRAYLEEIKYGDPALDFGLSSEIKKARRLYPHKHRCGGFFVAKIVKN